ncbi:collagen-like protein [bacterium]|nr:collagen-like protein [bacterium]
MAMVLAPDASGAIHEYQKPTKLAFTNAVGAIAALQTLTITPTSPSITTDDATSYPHGSLTEIVFNNMTHSVVNGTKLVQTGAPGATGSQGAAGSPGINGINGLNGNDGQPGATGAQGPKGDSATGQDGASAAMQTIRGGTNVYNSEGITEVVSPGANATLSGTILTLDPMQGSSVSDGAAAAMQTISVGGLVYNFSVLTSVVFPGASATLLDGVLTLDSMEGEDGHDDSDATRLPEAEASLWQAG